MSGSNVVPMTTPPPANVPWQQSAGLWPMPSTTLPGCCPPSGLMQSWCDIQNAMAFISAVMIDLINNNPDIAQAMIDAIVKSGAALPLVGVTNGSDAQPGQVGEWVEFAMDNVTYPSGSSVQTLSMGVLQPGDWNVWYIVYHNANPTNSSAIFLPLPTGFSGGAPSVQGRAGTILLSPQARASLTVPTLVPLQLTVDSTGASFCRVVVHARRMR